MHKRQNATIELVRQQSENLEETKNLIISEINKSKDNEERRGAIMIIKNRFAAIEIYLKDIAQIIVKNKLID